MTVCSGFARVPNFAHRALIGGPRVSSFACAIVLASLAALSANLKAQPAKQPNVVFIISDDLTATALGSYQNQVAVTPNLNVLASQGVQLNAAYCQYPVCGPSRASIMTGLYPRALGALSNGSSNFRPQFPNLVTLPQLFRQQGYTTARVSKIYHMGVPGDIMSGASGLDDPLSWDIAVNVMGPEQNAPGATEDLSPGNLGPGADFVKVESTLGDLFHADGLAATQAISLLDQFAGQAKPFFLAVGMVRPHVPLVAPANYFTPFPFMGIKLPFVPPGDLDDMPTPAISQANHIKYLMDDTQQRKAFGAYYASVSYMDAQVGRILAHLDQLNLRDETIVVFTSDHGYNLGEHTMWQKLSLFEDTLRVPLIVSDPAHAATQSTTSTRIVEMVDVYPTLAELAGVSMDTLPHGIHGRSFAELVADPTGPNWQDEVTYSITQNVAESLLTPQWRLNRWQNGQFELYDQVSDPNEFTNQADNPAFAAVLSDLTDQLIEFRTFSQSVPTVPKVPQPRRAVHFWDFEGPDHYQDKAGATDGNVFPSTSITIDVGHDGGDAMRAISLIADADDFVTLDSGTIFNPGVEPFAFSYWFNIANDGVANNRGLFDFSGNGLDGVQSLFVASSSQLAFRVDGINGFALANIPIVEDGQWHFVAANFDPAGNLQVHFDGAGVDATTAASGVGSVMMATPQLLGTFNFSGTAENKGLNGRLDDLAIYNGLLTDEEIAGLFDGSLSPLEIADFLLGDINCDGVVNLLDVNPFIDLLSSGKYSHKADFDGDGAVTLLDIFGFVAALSEE